jgi:nucleoside-diphosphate-sugar epimerase
VESNARIKLKAAGNVTVELALSHTHQLSNEVVIKGSRGEIRAEVNQFSKCRWYSYDAGTVADLEPRVPFRAGPLPTNDFVSAFAEQFYAFSRVIAREEEPMVTAATAAESQSAVEWAYRNRRKIFHVMPRRRRPELEVGPAVVTGGTGFLGGALVERLAELQFDQIRVPVRSMRTTANVARFPIDRVFTDLTDFASTKAALKGARYVFHLAYGASGPNAGEITIAANRNVIEAAIENGAEAVVVASTASVFGHPETSTPIDEMFPYRPSLGDYGESKAEAEKFCLERAKSSGKTRIVVVNPSAIYGPSGFLFTQLPPQSAREGSFCWIENGRGRINYTFVGSVVDALILAAKNSKAHGQRFIINDGVTTFRKFLTPILGDHAEGLRSFTKQELQALEKQNQAGPRDLLRALTSDQMMSVVNRMPVLAGPKSLIEHRLAGFYRKMQSRRSGLQATARPAAAAAAALPNPPVWLADIYGPIEVEYSSAKAREILGWTPMVSLDEGTEISIEWLKYVGLFESAAEPVRVLS